MTDNKKLLQRARKILEEFHIADIFVDLHEQRYRYESTQSVDFSKYAPPVAVNDDIKRAVILRQDGHEMVLGFGSFSYGDALSDQELLSNLVYAEEIKRRPGWVVRSLLR